MKIVTQEVWVALVSTWFIGIVLIIGFFGKNFDNFILDEEDLPGIFIFNSIVILSLVLIIIYLLLRE